MASFAQQFMSRIIQEGDVRRKAERRAFEKIELDKLNLLAKPAAVDKIVADFTTMVSPSKAKFRTDFISKTEAAEANIPDDHPMKGYGLNLKEDLRNELKNPDNAGYSADQIVLALAESSAAPLIESSHKYKYQKDYRPGNWFGAFGEDENVKALPGYEEFKERQGAITPEEMKTSYAEALGVGGVFATAGQLSRRAAIKWGGKRLASWGAKRLVTGAALGPHIGLAALAAIPMFKVFDATSNIISRTHFGKSQGAWTKGLTELALGGLVPAYAGHKFLTKSITAATKANLIKGKAEEMLMRLPTARNAIQLGRAMRKDVKMASAVDDAIDALSNDKTAKRAFFKATEDIYEPRRAGMEGLSKFERREINKDLFAPFKKQFLGVETKGRENLSHVFANFTDEQADVALVRAKTLGIRKATQQVDEGAKILEEQRLKEIRDGLYKGLENVSESRFLPKHKKGELVDSLKNLKKRRLLKKVENEAKNVTKEVDDAVDKDILAAKMAELSGDIEASKLRIAAMNKRFKKTGLYKTETGKTVWKKGKKKEVLQVPDEVVKAKEDAVDTINASTIQLPEGMEEISYQEAKRRILKSMMAKENPIKEEISVKPAIENAKTAIGNQLKKQENRPLLKSETDDAEWLARAGESETIEDMYASTDGLIRKEFDPGKWKFFIAGGAMIPLLNVLDTEEPGMKVATAGLSADGIKVMANSKIPKIVLDFLKGKAKSVKELNKEIINSKYVYIPATEDQKVFGQRMKTISVSAMVAERGETLADQVIRSKSLPFGLDRMMSAGGFSRLFMKAGGEAAIELGNKDIAMKCMIEKGLGVFDNQVKNIKGYNANPNDIIKAMSPLADRFAPQVGAHNAIEFSIKSIEKKRDETLKLLKKGKFKGQDKIDAYKELDVARNSLSKLNESLEELSPVVRKFNADYEITTKALAKDNPAVRMSLAAEDTVDFKYRPWLKDIMTFDEIEAVGFHKKLMEDYSEWIVKAYGKDAVIKSRPYIHHAFHPNWRTKFINDELARLKLNISPHPPYTEFHSRSKYSRQMVPHIGFNTGKYIPDAEKRIHIGEFWGRGKRGSWHELWKSPMVQGSEALREFFQRIHNASIPASDHWSNRAANWYTSIEVFRLLGLSTSVAFKHLFKIPGTWAQLGFTEALKHVPESLRIFSRTFAQSKGGRDLAKRLNLSGVKGERAATDLVTNTFARQYGYMNAIIDMDMSVNVHSAFESGLKFLNQKGGILVRGVEHFDRAHGILAATSQAAKKGMTAKQAVYGVVDTIIKNNFLSGTLNPSWMHSPKVRALFLFQNTAFKIAERRLVGGVRALELSKAVGKSIKEKGLKKSLEELRGIRQFIKEGEHEFKESIILDALNADRGYFGTPQSVQFMKEMLIMGAIVGAGGTAGADLWEHVNHIPFLKGHTKYPVIATSPIFNAMFDVKGNRAAAAKASRAPDFLMVDFLKEWLWQGKYGPYPQTVKKAMRLSNNDIPKRYRDSKFNYLFGIPATE